MRMRMGAGWQYAMTDLSLILFLIAARGLAQPAAPAQAAPSQPLVAEPVAVWRQAPNAPTLADWLAAQPHDPRQRLTIAAHYAGSDPGESAQAASQLLAQAGHRTGPVRLLVEPGSSDEVIATLTWDAQSFATEASIPEGASK